MSQIRSWSNEEIELAVRLWLDGVSGSEIARQMNRTRNGVLGILHRKKVKRGAATVELVKRQPNLRKIVPKVVKPKRVKIGGAEIQAALGLEPLGDGPIANAGCCKFLAMDWDRCCGRSVERPFASYCNVHHAVAHRQQEAA